MLFLDLLDQTNILAKMKQLTYILFFCFEKIQRYVANQYSIIDK